VTARSVVRQWQTASDWMAKVEELSFRTSAASRTVTERWWGHEKMVLQLKSVDQKSMVVYDRLPSETSSFHIEHGSYPPQNNDAQLKLSAYMDQR
jgi:hypothetical protein